MKTCEHCGAKKCCVCLTWFTEPKKSFVKNRANTDGLSAACKDCVKIGTENRFRKRFGIGLVVPSPVPTQW